MDKQSTRPAKPAKPGQVAKPAAAPHKAPHNVKKNAAARGQKNQAVAAAAPNHQTQGPQKNGGQEKDQPRRSVPRRLAKIAAGVALWCIPAIAVFFFVFIANVRRAEIKDITVKGDVALSEQEIKRIADVKLPVLYLDINTAKIEKRLEDHPLIYSARVKKTMSGELVLILTRSQPLVAVLATVNGVEMPAYFDAAGRVVQVGVEGGIVDVPVVSGLALVDPAAGVFAPEWVKEFLASLAKIKKSNSALFNSVSEFRIVSDADAYRMLEIWFTQFPQKYITSIDIGVKDLEKLFVFADRINKEQFAAEFSSFDVRQGVIIGKRSK